MPNPIEELINQLTYFQEQFSDFLKKNYPEQATLVDTLLARLNKRPLVSPVIEPEEIVALENLYDNCQNKFLNDVTNNSKLNENQKEYIQTAVTENKSEAALSEGLLGMFNKENKIPEDNLGHNYAAYNKSTRQRTPEQLEQSKKTALFYKTIQGIPQQYSALWQLQESFKIFREKTQLSKNITEINDIIESDQNAMDRETFTDIISAINQGLKTNDALQVFENFYHLNQYMWSTLGEKLKERQSDVTPEDCRTAAFNACNTWLENENISDPARLSVLREAISNRGYQENQVARDAEARPSLIRRISDGCEFYRTILKTPVNEEDSHVNSDTEYQEKVSTALDVLMENADNLVQYEQCITKVCENLMIIPTTKFTLIAHFFANTCLQEINKVVSEAFENVPSISNEEKKTFTHQLRQDVFHYQIAHVPQIIKQQKKFHEHETDDVSKTKAAQKAFIEQIIDLIKQTDWKVGFMRSITGERIYDRDKNDFKVLPNNVEQIFEKCIRLKDESLSNETWNKKFEEIVNIGKTAAITKGSLRIMGWELSSKRDGKTQEFYNAFKDYSETPKPAI